MGTVASIEKMISLKKNLSAKTENADVAMGACFNIPFSQQKNVHVTLFMLPTRRGSLMEGQFQGSMSNPAKV